MKRTALPIRSAVAIALVLSFACAAESVASTGYSSVPHPAACPARYSPESPPQPPARPSFAAFIEYAAPMAIEVQLATGLPASLLIAQAFIESGGVSHGFRQRRNPFGTRCGRPGNRVQSFPTDSGQIVSYLERCEGRMPSYYSFDDMMSGFWSQAFFYLHRPELAGPMGGVRRTVFGRPNRRAPANVHQVVDQIRGYAQAGDAIYQAELRSTIRNGNLEFYDRCGLMRLSQQ